MSGAPSSSRLPYDCHGALDRSSICTDFCFMATCVAAAAMTPTSSAQILSGPFFERELRGRVGNGERRDAEQAPHRLSVGIIVSRPASSCAPAGLRSCGRDGATSDSGIL